MTSPQPLPLDPPDTVRFVLDGQVRVVEVRDPTRTVLQWLRETVFRTGTKEGCAEGDCGACTVVLAELVDEKQIDEKRVDEKRVDEKRSDGKRVDERSGDERRANDRRPDAKQVDGRVRYRAVNACIQLLPTLDGKALFTVESLRDRDTGRLHPVQQAMVDAHGAQCGFCTPGIVMSLFALYQHDPQPDRRAITDALAGNLCRCTGYRPIVEAAERMGRTAAGADAVHRANDDAPARLAAQLKALQRRSSLRINATTNATTIATTGTTTNATPNATTNANSGRYFAPASLTELAELLVAMPHARMVAGCTDVGLWITKQLREIGDMVYVCGVAELKQIALTDAHIVIGAAVPLSDAFEVLATHYPRLHDFFRRFASPPIRNAGTLGGNIANGSPIGDSIPVLIALGARVAMVRGSMHRELPLEALYLGYQKTGLHAGEFIERVIVPRPASDTLIGAYKISKRFDQDISAVCAGFALSMADGRIDAARVAFGGMAATPKRATACEAVLTGAPWDAATCARAMQALDRDFTPISDMRASGEYRRTVARNLLHKFLLESTRAIGAAPADLYDFALPVGGEP